ncbi:hypothetical protein AB1N83_002405 [Pleurotus pulmonarius]
MGYKSCPYRQCRELKRTQGQRYIHPYTSRTWNRTVAMYSNPPAPAPTRVFLKCYKFAMLGVYGVGKTSLATQFATESFFDVVCPPAIASLLRVQLKQILVDEVLCLVETLDCEDGEEYLGLRDAYIRNSHGFVFVYSITSRASFEKIEHFYNSVLRLKGEHPVGIIVGNKRDKSNQRAVTTEEGRELAVRLGCEFAETSAKTADNVDKLFPDLIRVIRHLSVHEPLEPSDPSHSHRSGDRRPDRNPHGPARTVDQLFTAPLILLISLGPGEPGEPGAAIMYTACVVCYECLAHRKGGLSVSGKTLRVSANERSPYVALKQA